MELSREEILRYAGFRGKTAAVPTELSRRLDELLRAAPISPRSTFKRIGDELLLVGTIGADFDRWHRRLALTSAADALLAQAIGAAAVEAVMDALEARAKASVASRGENFGPRRSPGYGEMPLARSAEILEKTGGTAATGVHCTADFLLVPSKSVTAVCRLRSGG